MIEWARIQAILAVLDRIRPVLQADGMNVELLDVQNKNVRVRLTGLCAMCASARLMLQSGLEEVLRQQIPDCGELQLVYEAGQSISSAEEAVVRDGQTQHGQGPPWL